MAKKSLSGSDTLTGSLLGTSIYDAASFTPSNGEVSVGVVFVVEFDVRRDGEVIESASASESATVTVREEELAYTAEMSASGSIEVVTS